MISKTSEVADFYDEMGRASDYDQFWTYDKALYDQIHPILNKHIKNIKDYDLGILDLGCGTGEQTMILCKRGFRKVIGLDLSKNLLKICRTKTTIFSPRPFFMNSDAIALPFKDETFACIVCFYNVLNHIPQYPRAIKEMYRVLKKGGTILLEIEKTSISDLFFGGLDLLLGGIFGYEMTFHEWFEQLKRPFSTMKARWTYRSKQLSYWRFSSKDVERKCQNVGFHVKQKYGISILSGMIPWGLLKTSSKLARSASTFLRHIDSKIGSHPILRDFGLNTVYLMEK